MWRGGYCWAIYQNPESLRLHISKREWNIRSKMCGMLVMFVDLRLCNHGLYLILYFVLRIHCHIYIRNRCPSNNISEKKEVSPLAQAENSEHLNHWPPEKPHQHSNESLEYQEEQKQTCRTSARDKSRHRKNPATSNRPNSRRRREKKKAMAPAPESAS